MSEDIIYLDQVREARRREAFGGGEEDECPCNQCAEAVGSVAPIADDGPFTEESAPDPEFVEWQGTQVEVTDPELDGMDVIIRRDQIGTALLEALRDAPSSSVETFEDVAQEVFDEAFNLLIERQKKYGPRNIEDQGPLGVINRIEKDKLNRIKRAFNGSVVKGEIVLDSIDMGGEEGDTLEDALLDVANYALITLLLIRGKWGKPLAEEVA